MNNFFQWLQRQLSKPLLFGLYGAIACLIAAIFLGEPFLELTKLPPSLQQQDQAIVLLIDSSGSMAGSKLDEVKTAALKFVQRRNLQQDQLSVVNFGGIVQTLAPLSQNQLQLLTSVQKLESHGGTPMDKGIATAIAQLQATNLKRNILLFTDGQPDSATDALFKAQQAKNEQIYIIAVATGDADINFLSQVTGDRNLVFYANSGQFDQAFRDAETAIYGRQLVESSDSGDYNLIQSALRISGWTFLLILGMSFALIMGQNFYLHRQLLTFKELYAIGGGSLVAGLVAGSSGQLLFLGISNVNQAFLIGLIGIWTIIGALMTWALSYISKKTRSPLTIVQGAIAGGIYGTMLWYLALHIGVIAAALISTAFLAICLGLILSSQAVFWLSGIATLFLSHWFLNPSITIPPTIEIIARILGWTILGALVGIGIRFVPNLKPLRALIGGSLGGSLGAIGFIITAIIFGDLWGRFLGATILGFCIGVMIFWEEAKQLQTEAYILVHWSEKEQSKILLGKRPILLGTSLDAQIPLRKSDGYFPITAKIFMQESQVFIEYDSEYAQVKKMRITKQELRAEDKRKFGEIILEIKL